MITFFCGVLRARGTRPLTSASVSGEDVTCGNDSSACRLALPGGELSLCMVTVTVAAVIDVVLATVTMTSLTVTGLKTARQSATVPLRRVPPLLRYMTSIHDVRLLQDGGVAPTAMAGTT